MQFISQPQHETDAEAERLWREHNEQLQTSLPDVSFCTLDLIKDVVQDFIQTHLNFIS